MVSLDQWEAIKSLPWQSTRFITCGSTTISAHQTQFELNTGFGEFPLLTLLRDTLENKIYVGSRLKKLYRLNENLLPEDSFELPSPPSHIIFTKPDPVVSLMGIMDPNDQAKGELSILKMNSKRGTGLLTR
jgi:hypothetical protein